MASAFTHAIAGLVIGTAFRPHYESTLGHRGFTHSIFFAALIALAALIVFRDRAHDGERPRLGMTA